jgi:ABC-type multidrug transport system ATPase subunit
MGDNGNGSIAGEAVVDAEAVRVTFGKFEAVRDVSLQLRGRDLLGLIGPNGAGKTTFIKILLGVVRPTEGTRRSTPRSAGWPPRRSQRQREYVL